MDLTIADALGYVSPLLTSLMVFAGVIHARLASRKHSPREYFMTPKMITLCVFHLLCAAGSYLHLIKGGWLTSHYTWSDPNNFNLVLAVFQAFIVVSVFALAIARKPFLYTLVVDLFFMQLLLLVVILAFILIFVFTWHPKLF